MLRNTLQNLKNSFFRTSVLYDFTLCFCLCQSILTHSNSNFISSVNDPFNTFIASASSALSFRRFSKYILPFISSLLSTYTSAVNSFRVCPSVLATADKSYPAFRMIVVYVYLRPRHVVYGKPLSSMKLCSLFYK